MNKTRLEVKDTVTDAIFKLSDGNPGAVSVMAGLVKISEAVDPDDVFGPFGPMICLDSYGIYGSRIWVLYKYCCGECYINMLAVLRAVQLGSMKESVVQKAIECLTALDCDSILLKVRERLPQFADAVATAAVEDM
jgi:hypothetical protein